MRKKERSKRLKPLDCTQSAEVIQYPPVGRVQVGDIVMRKPISFSDTDSKNAQLMRGVVVWVHPKGRFHVVEFGEGSRAVRESFSGVRR